MRIYEVLIEYTSSALDRPFSYVYKGEEEIKLYTRVLVPFNNRLVCGFVLNIVDSDMSIDEYKQKTGFILKEIKSVIDKEPLLTSKLNDLAHQVKDYYFSPLISVYFAMLPPSLKPQSGYDNKPKIAYESFVKPAIGATLDNLTTRQAEVLYQLMQKGETKKSEVPDFILKKLVEKGKVLVYNVEKNRLKINDVKHADDLVLNEEQQLAYDTIINNPGNIFLLDGVTGSGKTEVYLQASRKIIEEGKTVLMLVPEITLTYQMVKRFKERFERIAILHSSLTYAQRYDEYRRISKGEVDIVIGARSAIFAPLDNIGLIIIDEEHSETYKQEDQLPYYNAIEVAKMRKNQEFCSLLLGSATPSLETKTRALKGVYTHLKLTKRVNGLELPKVKVVNMANRENINAQSTIISLPLRSAIEERLTNKEQVILLVNRRGYSPYVSCRSCGYVLKCPECKIAMTYHKESNSLMCHHCGHETMMVYTCPKCQSNKILKSGFGSEKIEQEINALFPNARTLRLDSDVTKKKNLTAKVIEDFENHNADILIGTQIVAKGHDFPNVTLMGVVLADVGIAIPSCRAGERTFNLITQAIGRSGRNKQGEAIIQTYLPDNYVIKNGAKQDYEQFFNMEMYYRKLLQNPPYTYLTLLMVSGNSEDDVIDAVYEVEKYLKTHLNEEDNVTIIGPSEMFIKKFQNKYRRKLILKYKNFNIIKPLLEDLRLFFINKGSLTLTINVDPYDDY